MGEHDSKNRWVCGVYTYTYVHMSLTHIANGGPEGTCNLGGATQWKVASKFEEAHKCRSQDEWHLLFDEHGTPESFYLDMEVS